MALPPITPQQREAGLAKAVQVRRERALALTALRTGEVTFAAVLADADHPLQGMRVRQVLRALPRIGPVTADRILAEVGVDPKRRVGGLGSRQREALAGRLS